MREVENEVIELLNLYGHATSTIQMETGGRHIYCRVDDCRAGAAISLRITGMPIEIFRRVCPVLVG